MEHTSSRPLEGIRVLEMGQLLAGPWAGTMLAYFGAEVIKVEPPGGDPIRRWRHLDEEGTSFWWRSLARNKRCIVLNLREAEGRALAKELALQSDVLVENFRPGTMEKWGLGPEVFETAHPGLIYARVSGYGQDGPYASRPGYASVAEAVGGLRHLMGYSDRPPVRANLSLGDTLAGMHTALGVLLALYERDGKQSGRGQVIDTALYETVFNMLEAVMVEYDGAGVVRQPSGSTITGIVPSNLYPCSNGKWVVIGANGESLFRRLCAAMGRPELGDDPRFVDNPSRVANVEALEEAISAWTSTQTPGQVVDALVDASVPCGPIYDAADLRNDPHANARGLFERVDSPKGPVTLPAIVPKLSRTPGVSTWAGRTVGEDTRAVLQQRLRLDDGVLADYVARGIVEMPGDGRA